ncbi:MAG: FAD-dependent oxidoreductase [Planctomycetota bacterium]
MTQPNGTDSIAIVGGGVAGLTAARGLARAGRSVTVFDKGRGVSGRVSTRWADDPATGVERRFDHGAQYFTARDERFAADIARWTEAGAVAEWTGGLATIEASPVGARRVDPPSAKPRYVGVPGMNALGQRLAEEATAGGAQIAVGTRVGALKRAGELWRLTPALPDGGAGDDSLGEFGAVIVTAPAPQAAELLQASPAMANAAKSVRMTGGWAAMVAFEEPVAPHGDAGIDGAFINAAEGLEVSGDGEGSLVEAAGVAADATPLSWIARNGSKPGRPAGPGVGDCWVLHGSPAWSEARMELDAESATALMLHGFWRAVGAEPREAIYLSAHRWRYALPEPPLPDRCLADPGLSLYAAGDWCGGPRVEGAYLSGLAVAEAAIGASD